MSEFRVEIPVEVTAKSGGLTKLEAELTRLYSSAQRVGTASSAALSQMGSGAAAASAGMKSAEAGAQQAAAATEQMGQSAEKAADSTEKVGTAGQQAGQQASSGLEQASGAADKFSQRMEKTEQSIRKTFGQKIQLALEAIDKVSPVLTTIKNSVKNLTAKAWKVAVKMVDFVTAPFRALKNMITSPIMMTLGITGIGMGASSFVSTFQEFTAGMSNVKALSGATNEEFIKLTETAEQLGATTKFTATEASEGMQYLAMAGWKTNDIIAAMPGLLDLAAAGGTSLGTAADIVSDVMTAMGMSAEEASRAADIFARTATGSNTTIENLGESLKYAAPAAHAFGLELSEAATITGMMANAGVKGSMAGTALRASLLEMASPSKKAQSAMKALNLSFADSSGKMKDMRTIIGDLSKAFSGLSEQQKLSYAEDLFGTRGSSAWLAVIEQGADEYERLFEAIDNSNGAAKEMANTQLDNLAGDITLLQSAVDGMKISVMKELEPSLRKGVQWLTSKIPVISEKLSSVAKTAMEKFGQVKDFIVGVFNSPDFKNADGFADKLFVAWDKIIAEPFAQWWDGGGKDKILNLVGNIGKNLGEVYHGVISGIFAAIKGEEINFEGLNLTGLAKAGAEAAKAFVDNFKESFDIGGLIGDMPGLLKAGLIGFGALKIGGGAVGLLKTVGQLKLAFGGISTAASGAGSAIVGVGAKAVAGTGMMAKFGVGLKAVGTALSAIPVWGWVAAAAVAAVAAGVILYNKAQAEHEQALKDTGKAAKEYEERYVQTAQNVEKAMSAMDEIKKIQIQIEENKGGNQTVIAEVQEELDSILDRYVYVIAQLGDGTLTAEQAAAYQQELETVKGTIAEVEAKLKDKTLTAEEVAAYQKELEQLKGRKVELEAALKNGTLTASDIAAYQEELNALEGREVEVKATLVKEGYDVATAQSIIDQYNGVKSGQKTITLILRDKTELTAAEIQEYVSKLTTLMSTKTEKELYIYGSGLTPTEIEDYKTKLNDIKSKKAELELKIKEGQGSMTTAEWNSLVEEYNNLTGEAGKIEMIIKGSEANAEEIKKAKEEVAAVKGEAEGILLKLAYSEGSELTQEDLNTMASTLAQIGDHQFIAEVGLKNAGMSEEEIQSLIDKQNELYRNMVETSGGVFTQRDIEQGRITQEDYDWWVKTQQQKAEVERQEFNAQVIKDRENLPELMERADTAQERVDSAYENYEALREARKGYEEMDYQRRLMKINPDYFGDQYNGGISMEGREAIMQFAKDLGAAMPDNATAQSLADSANEGNFLNVLDYLFGNQSDKRWEELQGASEKDRDNAYKKYEEEAAKLKEYTDPMQRQYENEVAMATHDATANLPWESGLRSASIQDMAAGFANLDEAGKQAFATALEGIQKLNEEAEYIDYLPEDAVVNVEQVLDTAIGSVQTESVTAAIGDITAKLTEMKGIYDQVGEQGFTEEQAAAFKTLSESLNLKDIKGLEDIGSAIEQINALDPSSLDLSDEGIKSVSSALGTLGGDATTAESNLKAAKAAADALAGTYEVKVKYVTEGSLPDAPGNAYGGIYDGAFLSWVAEDGPEAIIPLGNDKRSRGLDLWLQAGRELGVSEFADGGIMAPYSGMLGDIPDGDAPGLPSAGSGGSGGNTIQVSAEVNPTFEINGGDGEDIIEKLKEKQKELAELFGGAIADQLEDIVANMV